jgi:hypothetical protein
VKSEELIREVDEELQREKMLALWNRYGWLVTGGIIAILVGVVAWLGWTEWQARALRQDSLAFEQAIELQNAGRHQEAAEALGRLAADGSSGFAALAQLRQAEALLAAGDQEAAASALAALAAQDGASDLLRQLATVQGQFLRLGSAEPQEIVATLEPLSGPDAPWRHLALEAQGLAWIEAGDLDRARQIFAELADDPLAPTNLQQRAAEFRDAISPAEGS